MTKDCGPREKFARGGKVKKGCYGGKMAKGGGIQKYAKGGAVSRNNEPPNGLMSKLDGGTRKNNLQY
jgi:hypothetical protein